MTRIVELSITGRITAAAIVGVAARCAPALESEARFAILFDRTAMTAFTDDGRAALEQWWGTVEAEVDARCAGWADLYDERRAASLRASAHVSDSAYPHQVFDDRSEAVTWLEARLAAFDTGS